MLGWVFDTVVAADIEAGDYASAAARLREQIARSDDDDARGTVIDRLLDLHIRHGPLPDLAGDLRDADDSADDHSTVAVALMAERVGLPTLGGALLGAALREQPDEIAPDRAARLGEAAETLRQSGYVDAACRVYESVIATDTEQARGRITLAYAQLSDLHLAAGRPALAADCLQHAIDRQDGPIARTRSGHSEVWTLEDQQACVYWYYLLDARYRRDAEAVRKFARLVLDSGSTEGSTFLDVYPDLPSAATATEIDAYFDRCFERARTRLAEAPDDPMYANDIAWLCARSGRRLDEAVGWAQHANTIMPGEAAYLDTLAEAKFRTGRVTEAIELESRALTLQPEEDVFMASQLARFRAAAATQPAR
jgi:tetratricopeptide (TPR) repeat protein